MEDAGSSHAGGGGISLFAVADAVDYFVVCDADSVWLFIQAARKLFVTFSSGYEADTEIAPKLGI